MSFIKKIATGQENSSTEPKEKFPKGLHYLCNNLPYIVKESFISDNTEMRRVVCAQNGEEEILTMFTLTRDLNGGIIVFPEDTEK